MFAYTGGNGAGCHATCTVSLSAGSEADRSLNPHQVPWKVPCSSCWAASGMLAD
jgi:hypothetical protein